MGFFSNSKKIDTKKAKEYVSSPSKSSGGSSYGRNIGSSSIDDSSAGGLRNRNLSGTSMSVAKAIDTFTKPLSLGTAGKSSYTPNTSSGLRSFEQPKQYNYQLEDQNKLSCAQYTAQARLANDQQAINALPTRVDTPGDAYFNLYLGGRPVNMNGMEDFVRENTGYQGPLNTDWCNAVLDKYGGYLRYTEKMAVASPTKKSPPEERLAWYAYYTRDYIADNEKLNQEVADCQKKASDFYRQYQKVYGREPSREEFLNSIDIGKYPTMKSINEALAGTGAMKVMPMGTMYNPDALTGWYYALKNGEDLDVGKDYFEDSVQYYMSPVQNSPVVQQYTWSNEDLSAVTPEERASYVAKLRSEGNFEEAAAYDYACWAAQPHDDGINAEPSPLDARFGCWHDEKFFNDFENSDLYPGYKACLNYDGTMDNPGKNADLEHQVYWEYYKIQKNRDKTNALEQELNGIKDTIWGCLKGHHEDYREADFDTFREDVLDGFGISAEDWDSKEYNNVEGFSSEMNDYLKNGFNPDKHCRDLPASKEGINKMIRMVWDGNNIFVNADFAANVDQDYEPTYGDVTPDPVPDFYDERQKNLSIQRSVDRTNAEKAIVDSVLAFADSGAQVGRDALVLTTDAFTRMTGLGDSLGGILGKLWKDVREGAIAEKLGPEYSDAQAAAVDPVLNMCDPDNAPDHITGMNVFYLANAYIFSRIKDDDITLAHGILGYAIPGIEHLHNALLDNPNLFSDTVHHLAFNALTYKSVYEDRVENSYDEEEAASIAYYAATTVNDAIQSISDRYSSVGALADASGRLISAISSEVGAIDTYDLLKAINDDISTYITENADDASGMISEQKTEDMKRLNSAIILGASDFASPGFRAETNGISHAIITGDITPEDVVDGVESFINWGDVSEEKPEAKDPFANAVWREANWSDGVWDRVVQTGDVGKTFTLPSGKQITDEERNDILFEAKDALNGSYGLLSNLGAYDAMSDDLKDMIGYDALLEANPDRDIAFHMVRNALEFACGDGTAYHRAYSANVNMEGYQSDFLGGLQALSDSATEDVINQNKVATRRYADQAAMEDFAASDKSGIFASIYVYLSGALGYDQSEQSKLIEDFRRFGKFLSPSEIQAASEAFDNGTVNRQQIEGLINERIQAIGGGSMDIAHAVVNARQNPDAMEKSYGELDTGLEKLGSNSSNPFTVDSIAQRLMDGEQVSDIDAQYPGYLTGDDITEITDILSLKDILDDSEVRSRLIEKLKPFEDKQQEEGVYSDEQIKAMSSVLDAYKGMGEAGIAIVYMDNDYLPDALKGTFNSPAEVLDAIDPNWSEPYSLNPGINTLAAPAVEIVGRGMGSGLRSVLKMPGLFHSFCNHMWNGILGKEYDPHTDDTFMGELYRGFEHLDQLNAEEQRRIATKGQAFVEKGIAEVVRNTLTSGAGAVAGASFFASMDPMASIAAASDTLGFMTTLVSRSPFATSVFLNDFDEQMKEGNSLLKSLALASVHTSVELFTEGNAFERWSSMRMGGFSIGDHAMNAVNNHGNALFSWGLNAAQNIMSEVNEEEFSEFAERVIGIGVDALEGKDIGEAARENFDGYGKAAVDTALATAFTTSIFGAVDLGGMTYDYFMDCSATGQKVDPERLMTCMQVDYALNQDDAQAEEANASPSASGYNPATDVPVFRSTRSDVEDQNTETTTQTRDYNPAIEIPTFYLHPETMGDGRRAAEEQLQTAISEATKDPSEENLAKVDEAIADVGAAIREENAQEPQEEVSEAPEADVQPNDNAALRASQELSDGARRVNAYMAHSETAMDEAVANAGADAEAEKVIAEDAGLKAKQQAIDALRSKIQEGQQKVDGLRQEAQVITNKMEQMFRAAFDVGLDENSPQVVNARNQQNQQKAAVESDAADQQEKVDSMTREAEEKQRELEEAKEQLRKETKESKGKELVDKIKETREQKIAEAKEQAKKNPQEKMQELEKDEEREINRQKAERTGSDVHSLHTTDEYVANKEAVAEEQKVKMDLYSDDLLKTKGTEKTENYVNPKFYRQKPVISDRRSEEWQDKAKQEQDRLNADVEAEREQRLNNDFQSFREQHAPLKYLKATRELFNKVKQKVNALTNSIYDDPRYLKTSDDFGGPAPVYSQKVQKAVKQGNGKTRLYTTYDQTAEERQSKETPPIYSADDFLNDDGTVTGLAFHAIVAVDPDFKNVVSTGSQSIDTVSGRITKHDRGAMVSLKNGGKDAVLEHFSENDRYLLLATPHRAQQESYEDSQIAKDSVKAYQKMVAKQQKAVDEYKARVAYSTQRLSELGEVLNAQGTDNLDAAVEYKSTSDQLKKNQRGLQIAEQTLTSMQSELKQAMDFMESYNNQAKQNDKVIYVIDKKGLEGTKTPAELYKDAFLYACDRIGDSFFDDSDEGMRDYLKAAARAYDKDVAKDLIESHVDTSDLDESPLKGAESVEQLLSDRFDNMSHEDLLVAVFDQLLNEHLDTAYNQQYSDMVQVIQGEDGKTADKLAAEFIKEHGGYTRDGFGGEGFAEFSKPGYYNKERAYFISEEAALKCLTPEEQKQIGLKTTSALYDLSIGQSIDEFARENDLSEADRNQLREAFYTRASDPKMIGKSSRVVGHDDTHFIGVTDKNMYDPEKNTWIRGDDGVTIDIDLAKLRLKNKMQEMAQTAQDEVTGGSRRKVNTKTDSIECTFTDDSGIPRGKVKIGDFYSWWHGGSRFFPSFDWLMANADEITCNFPCIRGKHNTDTFVSFALKIANTETADDMRKEAAMPDLEGDESELGHLKGKEEAAAELDKIENFVVKLFGKSLDELDGDKNLSDLENRMVLAGTHAAYNDARAEFKYAMQQAKSCAADALEFWQGEAERAYNKLQELGASIQKQEEKYALMDKNRKIEAKPGKPEERPASERLAEAQERYDQLTSGDPKYDLTIYDTERASLAALIPHLQELADQEGEQSTASEPQPVEKRDDPAARKVAEEIAADPKANDIAKLAALKSLSDTGANIDDIRGTAIQEHHEKQMEGMTSEEKMDYLAGLSEQQQNGEESALIDPNANYDQQLGQVMQAEAEKQNGKLAKRLKAIGKKAGSYERAAYINKALAELDEIEKAGHDVGTVREALNANLERMNNPEAVAPKAEPISSFRGDNAFLSNFYEAPITIDGITYRNAEAAFQAQKLENAEERRQFANLDGKAAKRLGRSVQLRSDWNTARDDAMKAVLEAKFSQNPELMQKLRATGNADLIEGNTWNDTYWGVSNGQGENNLGKLLMGIRDGKQNANLERLNNPEAEVEAPVAEAQDQPSEASYQAKKKALIESEPDSDFRMNLRLFSNNTQEEAVEDIMSGMPSLTEEDIIVESLRNQMTEPADGGPGTPVNIDTGFNQMIEDVLNANATINNEEQFKAVAKEIVDLKARIDSLNDLIGGQVKDRRLAENERDKANAVAKQLLDTTNTRFTDSRIAGQYDKLATKISSVLDQIEQTEADIREHGESEKSSALMDGLAKDLQETRSLMEALEADAGATWTDEQRREYGQLINRVRLMEGDASKAKSDQVTLEQERNDTKLRYKSLTRALDNSAYAQQLIHNETTFNPTEIEGNEGETAKQIFARRLQRVREGANKLRDNIKKSSLYIHDIETSITPENMANLLRDGIIDEKRLDFDRDVAFSANEGLKEHKMGLALLDYGIQLGYFKTGKVDAEALKVAEENARQQIFDLTKLYGYNTEEDRRREVKAREHAKRVVDQYTAHLNNHVFTGSIDAGLNLLNFHKQVLNNKVENVEKAVHDFFGMSSTDDILKSLNGSNGGRQPQAIMDVMVGAVYNSMFKKNGEYKTNTFHPLSRALRSFREYNTNMLGEYAPIVNSILVDPVLQGENRAVAWKKQMKDMLDVAKLKDKRLAEAMGHILDTNMTDEEIRSAYEDDADVLIKARPIYRSVYESAIQDQNIVRTRNGKDPIKWRDHYFTHYQEEQDALFRALGINSEADKLPTGLLGHTTDTVPSSQWASHTLERTEDSTENINWNANEVIDRYLDSAAAIIFQTDNLVRINDFISALGGNRKQTGDMNMDAAAISPLEHSAIGELAKRGKYSLYVKALETWRDQVAGKKTGFLDRTLEGQASRAALSALQTLTKIQGVAKVGGNLKTCFLNGVPMVTSAAMHPFTSVKAGYSIISNALSGQSLFDYPDLQRSGFFRARCEKGRKANCTFDKATGWLFIPMEYTDRISTAYTWLGNYYSILNQLGGVGNETQAAQMADVMTSSMMSSKLRGDKGEAYNSTVGGAMLQFTQEAVNQIGFLWKDMARFHGGRGKGLAKALASLAAMFIAGFYGNKLIGANSTIDPIGAGKHGVDAFRDGKSASEAIGTALTDFVDQLNPIDNITTGNVFDTPVATGISDIFKSFGGGFDALLSSVFDQEDDDDADDTKWMKDLAKAAWGWVPGSTAFGRVKDTYQAATHGYATNTAGKIKYAFEPTVGNILKGLAFGTNSTAAGQDYVRSGYKTVQKSRAEGALSFQKMTGRSFAEALEMYDKTQAAESTQKEADEAARWGENGSSKVQEAAQLRSETLPDNMSQMARDNMEEPWMQKAIDMWRESGKVTYPTDLTTYYDAERGAYVKDDGRNIAVSEEALAAANETYMRRAKHIIMDNDDPKEVEKQLNKLKTRMKKQIGGE